MIRKSMLLLAAILLAASVMPNGADASPYRVIRWHGTNWCQVWDYGFSHPVGWYDVMSKRKGAFEAAARKQHRLWRKGRCPNG